MAATMKIYNISTILLTFYFLYTLYTKEKQFFIISLYLVKSKFHLCVVLNLLLMVIINVGNIFVHIFFGEINLRDLMEITEKIRVKLITFLLFFLTFRPQIDISKILLIVTFFCVSFITWLTFKRSNFLIATRTSTFLQHLKILFLYCLVGVINYVMYSTIYILVEKSLSTNKKKSLDMVAESMDFLIYYLLSLEFLTLLLKMFSKYIKYIIELTQLYMGKVWDFKSISFAIISFIHYSIKLYVEITFCIVLVKNSVIPIFFMVDVLYSCYHLLKMITKFNDTIKVYSILKKLPDLVSKPTEEGNKDEEKICNICLGPIEVGKMLHCGHIFHLSCLKDWIQVNSTCPLCKESILKDKKPRADSFNAALNFNNKEKEHELKGSAINPNTIHMHNLKKVLEIQTLLNKARKSPLLESIFRHKLAGAISYSLPCAALINRTYENEILRLEIENSNNRIIELYEKPFQVLSKFHIDDKGVISLLK